MGCDDTLGGLLRDADADPLTQLLALALPEATPDSVTYGDAVAEASDEGSGEALAAMDPVAAALADADADADAVGDSRRLGLADAVA